MIGNVSRQRARNITIQALKKFRQAAVLKTCHISQILEKNKKLTTLLQEKNKTILQLRIELESLKNGNIKIADMHFSTKVYHALLNANLFDTDRILRINHSNELLQVNRIGEYSLKEILHKMREYGFNGWADKIESTINLPTYHYFQNLSVKKSCTTAFEPFNS